MDRRHVGRTAVCAAAAAVALGGAAEECGKSAGTGGSRNACSAWISQAPAAVHVGDGVLVEAVVVAECRERQQRHAVHVDLSRRSEQGAWLRVRTITETAIPQVGKKLSIPISSAECVPGQWRARFYVVGTTKAGAAYRYPGKGYESKTRRVRCG